MRKGFTLAEILIVIGILSLLMVSISPLMRGNQDQAMLSRQADLVRQSFYETVMKAKTGAAEASIPQGLPLRGFLFSERHQEIGSLLLQGMSFTEARALDLNALKARSTRGVNLLKTDIGKTSDVPLATLKQIQLEGRQTGEVLLLLEPVSNEVAVITESGSQSPVPLTIDVTMAHATSTRMTRTMTITPGTALMTEKE